MIFLGYRWECVIMKREKMPQNLVCECKRHAHKRFQRFQHAKKPQNDGLKCQHFKSQVSFYMQYLLLEDD